MLHSWGESKYLAWDSFVLEMGNTVMQVQYAYRYCKLSIDMLMCRCVSINKLCV